MAFQTLRIIERRETADRGCAGLRARARPELLRDAAPVNPTHIDARAQKRALERGLSVDAAEAGDLAHSVETRNRLARCVQHAAIEIHVDTAHALARDGKELGGVEGRRIDRLRLGERLLA